MRAFPRHAGYGSRSNARDEQELDEPPEVFQSPMRLVQRVADQIEGGRILSPWRRRVAPTL
jgi:hypothetical protein